MASTGISSINGKVVIITGATSGIGKEFARVFAAGGAKVVFLGRRADNGKALEEELKGKGFAATYVQGDVSSQEDLDKVVKTAESTYGGLDILVNNAAIESELAPLSDPKAVAGFDRVFDINVKGILRGFQAATPALKKRGAGAIINISSAGSTIPFEGFGVYVASKAAVDAISRVAAVELASSNISVHYINPYVFQSEMSSRASNGAPENFAAMFNPSGKLGKGEDLGRFLVELVEGKHAAKYPSGSGIAVEHDNANWPTSEVAGRFAEAVAAAKAKASQSS